MFILFVTSCLKSTGKKMQLNQPGRRTLKKHEKEEEIALHHQKVRCSAAIEPKNWLASSALMPQSARLSTRYLIVSLYKKEENLDCSNFRGITRLSIANKILARALLSRLNQTIAQDNTPESRCGLRSNRGTAVQGL